MKKLLVTVLATALAALGLVAVSSSPAQAACPYTACINTTTTVTAPAKVRKHRSVPISVTVTAPGNAQPEGKVTVTVRGPLGAIKYTSTQAYVGGTLTFVTQGFGRKGRYSVTAVFTPKPDSVWNGSSAATSFKVKKKKRRN